MPNGRESWVSSCGHKGEEIKCPKNNHQHLMYNLSLSRWERRYLNHWRLPGACWMTLSIVRKQQMGRGSIKSPPYLPLVIYCLEQTAPTLLKEKGVCDGLSACNSFVPLHWASNAGDSQPPPFCSSSVNSGNRALKFCQHLPTDYNPVCATSALVWQMALKPFQRASKHHSVSKTPVNYWVN